MDASHLKEIHDFLVSLAFKAGDIINNALPDASGTGSKKNSMFALRWHILPRTLDNSHRSAGADLVTEYDRAVENMISTSLKEKYPDYE